MLIAARNAMMVGKRILPPGARWVEYLESTGTQWIDTGYAFQDDFAWEITFNGLGYNQTLFGGRAVNIRTSLLFQPPQDYGAETVINIAGYNASSTLFVLPDLKSGTHTVKATFAANKGSVWVDGIAQYNNLSFSGTYISGVTQVVFADNFGNGDVREFANSKVYALKMLQNNTLVRNFAPIAIGNTGYMLDLLTGDYLQYGNKGTGNFIIGPDIAAPTI